jgi:hypothetical protein
MGSEGDPTEEGKAGADDEEQAEHSTAAAMEGEGRRTEPSDDEEEMQRLRDLEED